MTEPFNPYAVPESLDQKVDRSLRPLTIWELIAIVIATLLMTGMTFLFIRVASGVLVTIFQPFLDPELTVPAITGISTIIASYIGFVFARRALVVIRLPYGAEALSCDEEPSPFPNHDNAPIQE